MLKIDCHTHVMERSPERLIERCREGGIDRLNLLGVPVLCGAGNNFDCIRAKQILPGRAYCFGGLVWQGRECPAPEEQLRLMTAAGFDGLKLIESKPTVQKELDFHPQQQHFEALFALAEQENIPILWHVGDPASFWDSQKAPAFAVENGWTYDKEGFLSLSELYAEAEAVLSRHPRLRVIFAHLYFCSDDAPHLEALLERYPNLFIDITPGYEMYQQFANEQEFWQIFFEKHANRILMGSDMTDEAGDTNYQPIGRVIRGTLSPDPFEVWDISTTGFSLSRQALESIWSGNFERLCTDTPRPISAEGIKKLMAFYQKHLDDQNANAAMAAYTALTAAQEKKK